MKLLLSARQIQLAALASLAAIGACKDSTGTPQPKSVAQDQNTVAEGTAGTVLTAPPTFVVKDESGNAIGGVSVSITVTAGGGTLTGSPTKSNDGPTPVGTWKLGNIAGLNSVTVTVAGLPPLVINVTGKAGPPATIAFVAGANQSVAAGSAVPVAPVAQVRDQFGNGVAGAPVTFAVAEGEGSLASGGPVTADASGNAAAPQWTLGKSAVPQSLRASTTANITGTVSATIATSYNVDVRFFGPPMPPTAGALFTAAAARIKGAVIGDVFDIPAQVPGLNLESQTDGCGVEGLPANFSEPIDDVLIFASVGTIDGPGKVLAFSFPCFIRQPAPNLQTLIGIMKFDSEDLQTVITRGILGDVIQHEMLHVVGIGTLWKNLGLISGAGTPQSRYTGTLGVNGCIAVGGATVCPGLVPLETTGGPGTADSHWSEAVFNNELMTGFVNVCPALPCGVINPLSVMSIQSLGDLGYTVNMKSADPYTILTTPAARILGQLNVGNSSSASWEQLARPKFTVNRAGRVLPVAPQ
jgi:hypothetical protein